MDTQLTSEWNSSVEATVIEWAKQTLSGLQDEKPDDELVTYIAVMVGNRKKMSDVLNELKDFIDEDVARKFVVLLGEFIENMTTAQSDSDLKALNSSSISASASSSKVSLKSSINVNDILSKPLSSGRQSQQSKSNDKKKDGYNSRENSKSSSRLLQTALSSTRDSQRKEHGPQSFEKSQKRTIENSANSNNDEIITKRQRNQGDAMNQRGPPPFDNLVQLAMMSGYPSVDDMMHAFRNNLMPPMIAMMVGMALNMNMGLPPVNMPLPFHPPPMPGFSQNFHNDPSQFPGPMDINGPRFHGSFRGGGSRGRFQGRHPGRGHPGRSGNVPSDKPSKEPVANEVKDSENKVEVAPKLLEANPSTEILTSASPVEQSITSLASAPDRFSGRGGSFLRGRGRGRTPTGRSFPSFPGRGPPSNKNKVWVRQPDMETQLVSNR